MCDMCGSDVNPKTKELYEEWLNQGNGSAGGMLGAVYETGMIRLPEAGILILQKTTERTSLDSEGSKELPDSPTQGIMIHEDEMLDFMSGIFYQMGPEFMFKLLREDRDD